MRGLLLPAFNIVDGVGAFWKFWEPFAEPGAWEPVGELPFWLGWRPPLFGGGEFTPSFRGDCAC